MTLDQRHKQSAFHSSAFHTLPPPVGPTTLPFTPAVLTGSIGTPMTTHGRPPSANRSGCVPPAATTAPPMTLRRAFFGQR